MCKLRCFASELVKLNLTQMMEEAVVESPWSMQKQKPDSSLSRTEGFWAQTQSRDFVFYFLVILCHMHVVNLISGQFQLLFPGGLVDPVCGCSWQDT